MNMNAREHSIYSQLLILVQEKYGVGLMSVNAPVEFIAFLEYLDKSIPQSITTIHLVLDNLSVHKGKKVQAWLLKHPRFVFYHPPVHCSWMNQVEQWFSILQRKRLRIADFADKKELGDCAERRRPWRIALSAFIAEWNLVAHPFYWSSKSVLKVIAKCQVEHPQTDACTNQPIAA